MFFIALEGIDACGKTTITKKLKEYYEGRLYLGHGRHPVSFGDGVEVKFEQYKFPNYDNVTGRAILSHLESKWRCLEFDEEGDDVYDKYHDAMSFQCIQTANRVETLPNRMFDSMSPLSKVVVTDRYSASAMAYGSMDGLDIDWIEKINSVLPSPDIYFLIDISVDESIDRRPGRRDRYESDIEYLQKVRQTYLAIFEERTGPHRTKGSRWVIINGQQPESDVFADIIAELEAEYKTARPE